MPVMLRYLPIVWGKKKKNTYSRSTILGWGRENQPTNKQKTPQRNGIELNWQHLLAYQNNVPWSTPVESDFWDWSALLWRIRIDWTAAPPLAELCSYLVMLFTADWLIAPWLLSCATGREFDWTAVKLVPKPRLFLPLLLLKTAEPIDCVIETSHLFVCLFCFVVIWIGVLTGLRFVG